MIYTDKFADAIFEITQKKFWDIYNAKYPKLIAPGTLSKCLLKEPKFEFNNAYILLPSTILFSKSEKLEEKILAKAQKDKPKVEFYPVDKDRNLQVLENFILEPNSLTIKLSKEGQQVVSYRHFVESILPSLSKLSYDVTFTASGFIKPSYAVSSDESDDSDD